MTERAVIVTDVRSAFALVSVEVSLTERASREITRAFVLAAEHSSWIYQLFGGGPLLRIEAPVGSTVARDDRPGYVRRLAERVASDVCDHLTARGFDVRVVTKGAA